MSLTLRFWGTRGSVPTPGPRTVRYGGNTPCVELRSRAGGTLILDAGTGIRALGLELTARANGDAVRADILLTHTHWDHVQGLPFFAPLYRLDTQLRLWAPGPSEAVVDAISLVLSPQLFPVSYADVRDRLECRGLVPGTHRVSDFVVTAIPVRHPGGALGYRLRDATDPAGGEVVYVSDNELGELDAAGRAELARRIAGAALLIHDSTYTADEYAHRAGWGHSTHDAALDLALAAGVPRLILFHHSPDRGDDDVDRQLQACRSAAGDTGIRIDAAAEGMVLTL